jgi:hypothetical protein
MKHSLSVAIAIFIFTFAVQAENRTEFPTPEVTPEMFKETVCSFDTSAKAVYLHHCGSFITKGLDVGASNFFTYKGRIRFFDDKEAQKFKNITLMIDPEEEKIKNVNVVCYNLENGKVVSKKVSKRNFKRTKFRNGKRKSLEFSIPVEGLKQGSILDIEYLKTSKYMDVRTYYESGGKGHPVLSVEGRSELKYEPGLTERYVIEPWNYQMEYPVLHSEYIYEYSKLYELLRITKGYFTFKKDEMFEGESFGFVEPHPGSNLYFTSVDSLPAYKDRHTQSENDARANVYFEFRGFDYFNNSRGNIYEYHQLFVPWASQIQNYYNSQSRTSFYREAQGYAKLNLKKMNLEAIANDNDKINAIYTHIVDNFTGYLTGDRIPDLSLKKMKKFKKGNYVSMSLLGLAFFREAGYEAEMCFVKPRSEGALIEQIDEFYELSVPILRVKLNGQEKYIEFSSKYKSWNVPDYDYLTDMALVFDETAPEFVKAANVIPSRSDMQFRVNLNPESSNQVNIKKTGTGYVGVDMNSEYEAVSSDSKKVCSPEDSIKNIIGERLDLKLIGKLTCSDMLKREIQPKYSFTAEYKMGNNLSFPPFNGIVQNAMKQFDESGRTAPIQFDYPMVDNYELDLTIPASYKFTNVPESTTIFLDELGMAFQYKVIKEEDTKLKITASISYGFREYDASDYPEIKRFHEQIKQKLNEEIKLENI